MIEETGWLIELQGEVLPTWWGRIDSEDGVCGWTTDPGKAVRFSRSQDAQAIIDDIGWTRAIPTDHMWCDYSRYRALFAPHGSYYRVPFQQLHPRPSQIQPQF